MISVLIGVLLCAGPSTALPSDADHVDISGSWAVAGAGNSTPITATVFDSANNRVAGATVTFECMDPLLGRIAPSVVFTNAEGNASVLFYPNRTSGTARIQASAVRNTTATAVYLQEIDHNAPYGYASIDYLPKVSVNAVTTITVRIEDQFGNPVDSRRAVEQVQFTVASPGSGAAFVATGTPTATLPVDAAGNVVALLRVSPYAGNNLVLISPRVSTVPEWWITIQGVGSEPHAITQEFEPNRMPYPELPADGTSQFAVTYTLLDQWGNPSPNSSVRVTTTLGESVTLGPTNSLGQVKMQYGQKTSIGLVTISAQSLANATVRCSQVVGFSDIEAAMMDFTASSLTMGSLDANPEATAQMRARVMDLSGNPSQGESVTFVISDVQVIAGCQTQAPSFSTGGTTVTIETDSNGYAIATFVPGTFSTNQSDPEYRMFSGGSCIVRATWGNVTKSVIPSYKNYPYLRVETEVSNTTLEANSPLDVTIRLIGDGHNISFREPVDVVLAPSRAGTMMYQRPDIMTYAYAAQHAFIDVLQMNVPQGGDDAVGILSYGGNPNGSANLLALPKQALKYAGVDNTDADDESYILANYPGNGRTYSDFTTLEQPRIADLTAIKSQINRTVPYGDVTSGTVNPLRLALYRSVNEVATGQNQLKAVVVLVDNSWSYYGDPLARGNPTSDYTINEGNRYFPFTGLGVGTMSEQNMSIYAKNRNVRYYVVYFAAKENTNDRECLLNLAGSTGGAYNYTSDPTRLKEIYAWIAEQIINKAGVGATMDLELAGFDPEANLTYTGSELFDYQHVHTPEEAINSTEVFSYGWRGATDPYTPVNIMNRTTIDQGDEWNTTQALHFNIGTIHVEETWQTTFRLRVKDSINRTLQFRLFSPDSVIRFSNDQSANLNLYNSSPIITIYPHMNHTAPSSSTLNITSFRILNAEPSPLSLDLGWVVNYVGNYSVTQTVSYRYKNPATETWEDPVTFRTITFSNTTIGRNDDVSLDIRGFPLGVYEMKVSAEAENGGMAEQALIYTIGKGDHYIKIE